MKHWFNTIFQGLDAVLFPNLCLHCDRRITRKSDTALCPDCLRFIPLEFSGRCKKCGLFLGPGIPDPEECPNCRGRCFPFDAVCALGRYHDPLRDWIHDIKFHRRSVLGITLGRELGKRLKALELSSNPDCIVPVPLTPFKETRRGFNQAHIISRGVAEILNVSVFTDILVKIKSTIPQVELSRKERLENLSEQIYNVRSHRKIEGMHVLLIDDVMTTGGTATACSEVLKEAGAGQIVVGVLAR